jgi:hypothetical protein
MLEQFWMVFSFIQDFEKYILEIVLVLHDIHRNLENSGNNLTDWKK